MMSKKLQSFIFFMVMQIAIVCAQDVPLLTDFDIVSVDYLLKRNPSILYTKCHDQTSFHLEPFPLAQYANHRPEHGTFDETFVVTIPQGKVCSQYGFVVTDQRYMLRELTPQNYRFFHNVNLIKEAHFDNVRKVSGRVAVITRRDYDCFGHWLIDILGRLALIEIAGIEYDWLYIPVTKPYMKETLELWGVDPLKIIQPFDEFYYIQADELIVPSLVTRRVPTPYSACLDFAPLTVYYPDWVLDYVRNKFLPLAQQCLQHQEYSKKVFISRKDGTSRLITNEDEVFALFQEHGFCRYELSKMSFLQQVALFANAQIIVAPNGSGLANIMFCKPGTDIIELFQARPDSSFYNLAKAVDLNHLGVQTSPFHETGFFNTEIPLSIIQELLSKIHY